MCRFLYIRYFGICEYLRIFSPKNPVCGILDLAPECFMQKWFQIGIMVFSAIAIYFIRAWDCAACIFGT